MARRRTPSTPPAPSAEEVDRGLSALRRDVQTCSQAWEFTIGNTPILRRPPPNTAFAGNIHKNPFDVGMVLAAALRNRDVGISLVDNARDRDGRRLPSYLARYVTLSDFRTVDRVTYNAQGSGKHGRLFLSSLIDGYTRLATYEALTSRSRERGRALVALQWAPPAERQSWLERGYVTGEVLEWTGRLMNEGRPVEPRREQGLADIDSQSFALYGRLALRPDAEGGPVRPFDAEGLYGIGEVLVERILGPCPPDRA